MNLNEARVVLRDLAIRCALRHTKAEYDHAIAIDLVLARLRQVDTPAGSRIDHDCRLRALAEAEPGRPVEPEDAAAAAWALEQLAAERLRRGRLERELESMRRFSRAAFENLRQLIHPLRNLDQLAMQISMMAVSARAESAPADRDEAAEPRGGERC